MTYVITELCIDVKDKTCVDECPVDCIYEGERMLYIHPRRVRRLRAGMPGRGDLLRKRRARTVGAVTSPAGDGAVAWPTAAQGAAPRNR